MGGEKEYRERATAYAPEATISTSGGVALQISRSAPNKNRNFDTKGLRFLLTNVTAHDMMNTDNYSDVI